jgi:hypothetical protein
VKFPEAKFVLSGVGDAGDGGDGDGAELGRGGAAELRSDGGEVKARLLGGGGVAKMGFWSS